MVNIGLTMRGAWHKLSDNTPLQFVFAGFAMYVLVSIQGTLQGLRSTNAYLHFSQWPVSHSHLALLGGFGFLSVGMIFFLVPRIVGFKLYSHRLMRWSWWLAFIGFLSFFASMVVTGLQQNANWWSHINVVETLPTLQTDLVWRAVSGGVVVVAAILFAYNILVTFFRRGAAHETEGVEVIDRQSRRPHSDFLRRSQEHLNVPIIIGGGLAVFSVMTFMVVAMPYMFSGDAPSWRAHQLSAQEQEGQALYKSMGCFYCHNQFVRPQDWAMGYTSQTGDFYYSIPNFLGTERTGPSLGQIGGKRPTEWNVAHIADPRSVSPSSIMPSFGDFLSEDATRGANRLRAESGQRRPDYRRFSAAGARSIFGLAKTPMPPSWMRSRPLTTLTVVTTPARRGPETNGRDCSMMAKPTSPRNVFPATAPPETGRGLMPGRP